VVVVAIIAAEVTFWLLVVAGLCARYVLTWRTAGAVLLASTPLVDLALLALIMIDLRGGAEPHWSHGLGALYLGFSVAYGKRFVHWADRRFAAHRTGERPAPKPKLYGADKVRYEWRETGVFWLGIAVAAVILLGCIWLAGGPERGGELFAWVERLLLIGAASLIFPISYMIWPRRAPEEQSGSET
jgi:hypothetical protein